MIKWNNFAEDYHNKRRKPWKDVKLFIKELRDEGYKFSGLNIDLGCANGRHFEVFKNTHNKLIGIDNSIEFLKYAKNGLSKNKFTEPQSNQIELILADMAKLPLRENTINNIFSIATIHLVKNHDQRKKMFNDLHTLLKNNGYFLFTVWRRWQNKFRLHFIKEWFKRKLKPSYRLNQTKKGLTEFGDIYVPWTVSKEGKTYHRFYHFFSLRELHKYLEKFDIIKIEKRGGPGGKDNFYVLCKKNNEFNDTK